MTGDALAVCTNVMTTIDEGARDRDVHHTRIVQSNEQVGLFVFG
jgi:hypothetical protein